MVNVFIEELFKSFILINSKSCVQLIDVLRRANSGLICTIFRIYIGWKTYFNSSVGVSPKRFLKAR